MGLPSASQGMGFWEDASTLNWGIVFIEPDLTVYLGNELGAEWLDAVYGEKKTVPLSECLPSHSEEYRFLRGMVHSKQELRSSLVLWEIAGRIRHVLLDSYCQYMSDGSFAGMHVLVKDLGDFMMAEQQLQRYDRLQTIGKVAAGIAHEIRNPLTTIKGFVQILENCLPNDRNTEQFNERRYLEMIMAEIQRVEFIISDLLMMANPKKPDKQVLNVKQFLRNLQSEVDKRINGQGVEVLFQCEDSLFIRADEEMLTHAILNVVANAVDAMLEKRQDTKIPTLKVNAYRVRNCVQIDISDTGPGIPYYQVDKIFDAFYTTKESAVGLGLPICQKIISAHGGEIRISSKGFGTTVHLLLPNDS